MEEKTYTVPFTYAQAHGVLMGFGAMIMLMGPPPESAAHLIPKLVYGLGLPEEGTYEVALGDRTADLELTIEQLDVAVSATAALHALIKLGKLADCPHAEADVIAWGESLDALFQTVRVEAGV